MSVPDAVREKLDALPARPGCYVFRDSAGEPLYIGKAKSLRSRVRSYFQDGSSDDRGFIPLLRRQVADLETVVTATEKEAAILENSLIKTHRPRFNVKLRDDSNFLHLRLDLSEPWPRYTLVRAIEDDGARYFGPYASASRARTAYVAELLGTNLLEGDAAGTEIRVGASIVVAAEPADGPVFATLSPSALTLHTREPSGSARNRWPVEVEELDLVGERARARVRTDRGLRLVVEVTPAALAELGLRVGDAGWVAAKATEVVVYPR